jgi:nucleoid-associated protein YgaU
LLLGLVFIFIIAFIINGLPRFGTDKDSNDLTIQMVRSQNSDLGIGRREREVIQETGRLNLASFDYSGGAAAVETPAQSAAPARPTPPPRSTMPLPTASELIPETGTDVSRAAADPPPPPVVARIPEPAKDDPAKKLIAPKTYVVAAGDNLTKIAKRFYGPEEGNRIANVVRIFLANRDLLKSPDNILEGQKIVIPSLQDPYPHMETAKKVVSGSMFEKVKSIGRRYLVKDKPKPKAGRQYVVREDDSLWRIAAEHLGNGDRYPEIAKLNSDILENENFLMVGMRLRLPVQ